ncbi:MAG: DUF302 domain-containing protein [Vicinamibacterales bacterium]
MTEGLGFEVTLPLGFADARDAVKAALKTEGFGVLTEIDLQAAFKEKLGRDFRRYTILGACNPPLAYAAVSSDPNVGLLLPCNVTVEEDGAGASTVRLTDPLAMLGSAPGGLSAAIRDVATDAHARMSRVAAALRGQG